MNEYTISTDLVAREVASAAAAMGVKDPSAVEAAFIQASAGEKTTRLTEPLQSAAKKIAAALARNQPTGPAPAPAPITSSGSGSTSTRQSVTSKGTPEQLQRFETLTAEAQSAVDPVLAAYTTASNQAISATKRAGVETAAAGAANADFVQATADQKVEQATRQQSILDTMGLSVGNADSLYRKRIEEAAKFTEQRRGVADQINQNNQKDMLKDPLGWFFGQLQNDIALIPKHNSLVRMENAAMSDIADRQKLVNSQLAIEPAAAADKIAAVGTTQKAAVLAEAKAAATKAEAEAYRLQSQQKIEQMKLLQVPAEMQARLLQATTFTQGVSEAQAAADAEMEMFDAINRGRQSVGLQPLASKLELRSMNKEEASTFLKLGTGGTVGASPGEYIATLTAIGAGPEVIARVSATKATAIAQLQEGGRSYLMSLQAKAEDKDPKNFAVADAAAKQLRSLKPGAETQVFAIDGYLTEQREAFKTGLATTDNIYKLKIGEAAMDSTVATNGVIQRLRTSELKNLPAFGDKELVSMVVGEAKGNIKNIPKLADDIQQLYKQGLLVQFANRGYGSLGIKLPDAYPLAMGSDRVDLLNRQSIEAYLIQQVTRPAAAADLWFNRNYDTRMTDQEGNVRVPKREPAQGSTGVGIWR